MRASMLCSILFVLFPGAIILAAEPLDPSQAKADSDGKLLWYDIAKLGVEGQGWKETKASYDRLPAKAEELVRPPVWGLSRNSAGLCVRFETDAEAIHGRWTLTSNNLAMNHMPATGVSGLDLYARGDEGKWRWLGVGRPSQATNTAQLAGGIPGKQREYMVYLPLYNGVSSVEIGIPKEAKMLKAAPRTAAESKPILFYGTSITQGGCASRPGMVHTAILGRRLNRPVINLGFSGNGKMEPELSELLAELDPAVFVLDCLPNLSGKETAERVEPFVLRLRKSRPDTPILLVEDRYYDNAHLVASSKQHNEANHAALRTAFENLKAAGVTGLSYLPGDKLLGDDNEGTVDGSHPTDLGFVRMADAFEKALAPLLQKK